MCKLKKITDGFYMYESGNKVFTLKEGEVGVYRAGRCFRLRMTCGAVDECIACFVTHDDGYKIYRRCYEQKLWTTMYVILSESERLIERILN